MGKIDCYHSFFKEMLCLGEGIGKEGGCCGGGEVVEVEKWAKLIFITII